MVVHKESTEAAFKVAVSDCQVQQSHFDEIQLASSGWVHPGCEPGMLWDHLIAQLIAQQFWLVDANSD